MATYETVLRDAKSLSCDERALLAAEITSFENEDRDPDWEDAWLQEVRRRRDDIAAGRTVLIDEEEFERLAWDEDLVEIDAHPR